MREIFVILLLLSTCVTIAVLAAVIPPPASVSSASGRDQVFPRHLESCSQLHKTFCASDSSIHRTSDQQLPQRSIPNGDLKNARECYEQSCQCTDAQRKQCDAFKEGRDNRMNKRAETQESESSSIACILSLLSLSLLVRLSLNLPALSLRPHSPVSRKSTCAFFLRPK